MMMRSTRPIRRDLPSETLGPHCSDSADCCSGDRERSGVYHSFSRAQAGFLHFTIYSARIGLLAQANRNWSLNTRKHALTKVGLFTSMSPLPGGPWNAGGLAVCKCGAYQFSGLCAYFVRSALAL